MSYKCVTCHVDTFNNKKKESYLDLMINMSDEL